MDELRLWTVEIHTNNRGQSPARRSFYSKNHTVNVAAYDIISAINGAVDELRERFGEDWNDKDWTVTGASHKGRVNRIVERKTDGGREA